MNRSIALVTGAVILFILNSCRQPLVAVKIANAKHQLAVGLVTGAVAPSNEDITVTHSTIQLALIDLPTFCYFIVLGVYLTVLVIVRTRNRGLTGNE